ncbi:MAG: hypothetical protein AAF560_00865 [Acidobacteriota bacterium]
MTTASITKSAPPAIGGRSRVLFWIATSALILRLIYMSQHANSAFFSVAILDEKFYQELARALVAGRDVTQLNPGFRPWLYPLFVALWEQLAGEWGYVVTITLQHLLGVATAVLVADLAMRLFERASAGALAGTLYVLAGPPLFFEGELLITGLFTFLTTSLLWLASHAAAHAPHALGWWALAGAWTALAAQARPNALLFLAAFPAAALLFRRIDGRKRLALAASALAAAAVVLLGFAAVQYRLIGSFQLLGGSGGVNFYLGNKAGADGMIPRQDRRVTYGDEYRDSVQVFAEQLYREETQEAVTPRDAATTSTSEPTSVSLASEISHYWLGRTLEDISEDPRRWLGLLGRKLLFLTWNHEIPNNKSYDFIIQHESQLIALLPVRWWLLLSLGVLGWRHAWQQGRRQPLFWLSAFLALHSVGVVLFFVNSRYRIPMWPAACVLAAGGLLALAAAVRQRNGRQLLGCALVAGSVAALSSINWLRIEPPDFARDFFFRSLAHLQKGQLEPARADAINSVGLDPTSPAARFHLGNVMLALDDEVLAYRHYQVAATLSPNEPRILNNLGIVVERRTQPDKAYYYYASALKVADNYAPALINAALLDLRAGQLKLAEDKIARAVATGYQSVLLDCARAFAFARRGRVAEAEQILQAARRSDPKAVDRVINDQRHRLTPADLGFKPWEWELPQGVPGPTSQ